MAVGLTKVFGANTAPPVGVLEVSTGTKVWDRGKHRVATSSLAYLLAEFTPVIQPAGRSKRLVDQS